MASSPSVMSNWERGKRQREMIAAYQAGMSSREVGERFGVSGQWVRELAQLWGVARPVGRPRRAA